MTYLCICCQARRFSFFRVSFALSKDIKIKRSCVFKKRNDDVITQLFFIYRLYIPLALVTDIYSVSTSLFFGIKVSEFFMVAVFTKWTLHSVETPFKIA